LQEKFKLLWSGFIVVSAL